MVIRRLLALFKQCFQSQMQTLEIFSPASNTIYFPIMLPTCCIHSSIATRQRSSYFTVFITRSTICFRAAYVFSYTAAPMFACHRPAPFSSEVASHGYGQPGRSNSYHNRIIQILSGIFRFVPHSTLSISL